MAARKAQFSRDEIIETAFEMVRQEGWQGLSVPAVAKAINASTMPIYSHFKNVGELQDAVYLRAMDYLLEFMSVERSGDKWLDHALSYLKFASEEGNLFRCIFDGRNSELQAKSLQRWRDATAAQLLDYPLFAGLSAEQVQLIRYSRFMLIHGMATGIVNGWQYVEDWEAKESFLRKTSLALFKGLMMQFEEENRIK